LKKEESDPPLRLHPLEEAFAREAIRKRNADREHARNVARLAENLPAIIRLAENLSPRMSSKINEAAIRKFALRHRRGRVLKSWPEIKREAASLFPELQRPIDP
jgi:hypothetical protein